MINIVKLGADICEKEGGINSASALIFAAIIAAEAQDRQTKAMYSQTKAIQGLATAFVDISRSIDDFRHG